MTDRELMQQSLEALEWNLPVIEDYGDHEQLNRQHRAIIALRERLAQPEPPVLTGIDCSCGKKWRILNNTLTASEPETVMAAYKHQTYAAYKTGGEMKIGVVPEQEPVAWLVQYSNKHEFVWGQKPQWIADAIGIEPLYTAPQPRTWVGLTDEEVSKLIDNEIGFNSCWGPEEQFARAIEAALKEKNNG